MTTATNQPFCFLTGTPNEQICITKSSTTASSPLVVGNSYSSAGILPGFSATEMAQLAQFETNFNNALISNPDLVSELAGSLASAIIGQRDVTQAVADEPLRFIRFLEKPRMPLPLDRNRNR
jgi:DNA replicative helicase MCM subunit Mcm2 (Cdc46/Mcm family)